MDVCKGEERNKQNGWGREVSQCPQCYRGNTMCTFPTDGADKYENKSSQLKKCAVMQASQAF